ncbi:hypothetical protein BD309DRAFT_513580 [Dichomitus squalens]|uniref:Uncharacterized protein n=1 Tax=Dichomitus squalens TaxID=114155 RepID=A0A4Q9NDT0_9APHY|nr:hypothetical protein BD309DRAFT_513580 [Dichomitus squalens]TBU51546.1 hypothetical protein BD310DRAFT_335389 [Dichomitus squalens]
MLRSSPRAPQDKKVTRRLLPRLKSLGAHHYMLMRPSSLRKLPSSRSASSRPIRRPPYCLLLHSAVSTPSSCGAKPLNPAMIRPSPPPATPCSLQSLSNIYSNSPLLSQAVHSTMDLAIAKRSLLAAARYGLGTPSRRRTYTTW